MTQAGQIEALVQSDFPDGFRAFKPCAYFDDRLDCIRVMVRDCSVVEERVNNRITVLMDMYYAESNRKKFVGFTIKGARHFCEEHGLSLTSPISVSVLINAIVAGSPELVIQWFVDHVVTPLVQEEQIDKFDVRLLPAAA